MLDYFLLFPTFPINLKIKLKTTKGEREKYPRGGFGQCGESEAVIGVDREFGVDEEKDGLPYGIQSGDSRCFHLNKRLCVHVHAKYYVLVAFSCWFQSVTPCSTHRGVSFDSFHFHFPSISFLRERRHSNLPRGGTEGKRRGKEIAI